MSAAVDKARFYLEQQVPELRELEAKKLFARAEIQAINRKRSDFEHKLNAPGPSPTDWARYLAYELNLDTLRRKRAKRLGAKVSKHSGPRRIFALLERATTKFHGDLGLWMQYLDYAKKQKAYKRISAVWTKVVRLHPTKAELWVEAGRYAFEEQSDVAAARGYMQRGLRFCPRETGLWMAYFTLEMDYLARVSARAKKLGANKEEGAGAGAVTIVDEDENQILLPAANADDAFREDEGKQLVGSEVLQALSKSPALSGAIPMAIFDAAMKAFELGVATDLAADMFDAAASYDMPSRQKILDHISQHVLAVGPLTAAAKHFSITLPVVSTVINTGGFASSLAQSVGTLNELLAEKGPESAKLHYLSVRWLVSYLRIDGLDDMVAKALQITLRSVVASYQAHLQDSRRVRRSDCIMDEFSEATAILRLAGSVGSAADTVAFADVIRQVWPRKAVELPAETSLQVSGGGS